MDVFQVRHLGPGDELTPQLMVLHGYTLQAPKIPTIRTPSQSSRAHESRFGIRELLQASPEST